MTQAKKICRLGRGQSIGSRCDKFHAPPPQVSEASSLNQPFNVVNVRGLSDTHRHGHSKLRRGSTGFILPLTYPLPPSPPPKFRHFTQNPIRLYFFLTFRSGGASPCNFFL